MSLIKCPECKKKISDTTDSCPNCGYQLTPEEAAEIKKKEKRALKGSGIGCLVIVIAIFFLILNVNNDTEKDVPKTKEELRKEKIEKHFSAWDGSHQGLTKIIKESMNDPNSYEHVETRYWDKGDHLIVKTTFRGKNALGGVVKSLIMAKVDINGNVIEIIETISPL